MEYMICLSMELSLIFLFYVGYKVTTFDNNYYKNLED